MADNKEISQIFKLLSANLTAEVETHNKNNWESADTIRLYECLQAAICSTQHQFCGIEDPDYLQEPRINPSDLLRN